MTVQLAVHLCINQTAVLSAIVLVARFGSVAVVYQAIQ
ncbi:hypothetical protein C4K38_4677 [Pseudomonas chlororaphis subsp. piscium]|nr:hypothetical protein C4K38_4677 [Pseudomonas chlororaphis subsp. piscium]